jgi:hypothetical protein
MIIQLNSRFNLNNLGWPKLITFPAATYSMAPRYSGYTEIALVD